MAILDAYENQYINIEMILSLVQQLQITTSQEQCELLALIMQHNEDIRKKEQIHREKIILALKALNACQRCVKEPINPSDHQVIDNAEQDDMREVITSLEVAYEQTPSLLVECLNYLLSNPNFNVDRLHACLLKKINEAAFFNDTCPDPYYAHELKKTQTILEQGIEAREAREGVSR